jgi:hypothetical protein
MFPSKASCAAACASLPEGKSKVQSQEPEAISSALDFRLWTLDLLIYV